MPLSLIPGKIARFIFRLIKKLAYWFYQLSILGLSKGPHITRYQMYLEISKLHQPRPKDQKVLSISGSQFLAKSLGFEDQQILDVAYPEYNVLKLPFKDGEFDAVVSDQVLEHIEGDPQHAINEMMRVLKPNGISLQTTCFIYPVHAYPGDFWRFTPEALQYLVKNHGEILEVKGWGNPFVWPFVALGLQYQPIPNARWHPAHWLATKNTKSWPIVTWVLVKKK